MLNLEHHGTKFCDKITRREWLSVGSLATLGFSLSDFFTAKAKAESTGKEPPKVARAKACIQLYLWGGPGAQETWDLKPNAPEPTRGDFKPIGTSVPGIQFCEHLPLLAQRAHEYAIIRSQTHDGVNHGTSAYHMLTGHLHWSPGTLRHPTKKDMPSIGSNSARFLSHPNYLPPHVQLPAVINDGDGLPVPGQGAGILGDRHEPFRVLGNLTRKEFQVPSFALAKGVTRNRLGRRVSLQQAIAQQADYLSNSTEGRVFDTSYDRALSLLQSPKTDAAFDLSQEPDTLREQYGYHHFSQSLILARRLVEAGVPFVTVYWNAPTNLDNQSWDTHQNQHVRMREHLLPAFDRGLSALLDDLSNRGLLDETLVTWWGEFGRTPKINKNGGRDHWGFCQSVGLAGAGIKGGAVLGTSTKDGGYPETHPVSPDDLSATIFERLGIDHKQHMYDLQNRPARLSYGEPVDAILT
jgi:hypothetical protein